MTAFQSGVLQALIDYYNRLASDPQETVADFGFTREKVHFCAVLEPDGTLTDGSLTDVREQNANGKSVPALMLVPDGGGRSGTAIRPFFCWDNTGYVLGRDNKGKPERAEEAFAAFRDLHLAHKNDIKYEGYHALCRFLKQWSPSDAESIADWDEIAGKNIVFKLRGEQSYIHQNEEVRQAWRQTLSLAEPGEEGVSLLSGEPEELARLHPLIGGVAGANTMGAAIVSFNLDAFASYGKTQSYNAPLGVRDAFRYTEALKRLLVQPRRRSRIGDATVVHWSDRPTPVEDWFSEIVDESAEDQSTVDRVANFLRAARQGRLADILDDPAAPFYVLGLSPNASRLNVRFWLPGTVEQFAQRIAQHVEDLEMSGTREGPPLMVRGLIYESMPEGTASTRERYVAQLAGELVRAIFTGTSYPQALFIGILRRVRADQTMNHRRAAILKACIVRNARLAGRKKEVTVSLNKDQPDAAYQMGRLFAALEKTQQDALPGLNKSIKDGYFGTASATPAAVFPRLIRMHQHHIEKLEGGVRINRERLVQEICAHIDRFPNHLSLQQQGMFHIGYYHQRQDLFTSKKDSKAAEAELTSKETAS